ncbi:hypothetical protein [Devosia sp. 2618]
MEKRKTRLGRMIEALEAPMIDPAKIKELLRPADNADTDADAPGGRAA